MAENTAVAEKKKEIADLEAELKELTIRRLS